MTYVLFPVLHIVEENIKSLSLSLKGLMLEVAVKQIEILLVGELLSQEIESYLRVYVVRVINPGVHGKTEFVEVLVPY